MLPSYARGRAAHRERRPGDGRRDPRRPYYGHFARRAYGHGGARIPMWQGAAVLAPPADAGQERPAVGIWQKPYNGENPAGQIWMLSLFCDYVSITGDRDFAHGVLSPLAARLREFVRCGIPSATRVEW